MGPLNGLSGETRSFFCHPNPHWFLQPEIVRLCFPALEPWAVQSVLRLGPLAPQGVLPGFYLPHVSVGQTTFSTGHQLLLRRHHHTTSSPPRLPISAPPTCVHEYFFFKSLVVRLTCSLIFWQFWLFFCFEVSCDTSHDSTRR